MTVSLLNSRNIIKKLSVFPTVLNSEGTQSDIPYSKTIRTPLRNIFRRFFLTFFTMWTIWLQAFVVLESEYIQVSPVLSIFLCSMSWIDTGNQSWIVTLRCREQRSRVSLRVSGRLLTELKAGGKQRTTGSMRRFLCYFA
jgi:hypothetical protein